MLRGERTITPGPDEALPASGVVPRLRQLVQRHGGSVVVVGNCNRTDISEHLTSVFDRPPDIVSLDTRCRSRGSLISRIKSGRSVALVVLCEGFLSHSDVKPIRDACRARKIPYIYVNHGGLAEVRSAFLRYEQRIVA